DRQLALLDRYRKEKDELEAQYRDFEKLSERSAYLRTESAQLQAQLRAKTAARDVLQAEYEKSLARIENHKHAEDRVVAASEALAEAHGLRESRVEALQRLQEAKELTDLFGRELETRRENLLRADENLRNLKEEQRKLAEAARELRTRQADL